MKNFLGASLALVTVLFILTCTIFWFNIKKDPDTVSRGFGQMVAASNTGDRLGYKIADGVFASDEPDTMGGSTELYVKLVDQYEQNYYPYCFVCGWNMGKPGPFILKPHKKDGFIYSGEPTFAWTGTDYDRSKDVYHILDTKTWSFTSVNTSEDLAAQGMAIDPQFRMKYDEVKDKEVLTFDNESCFIVVSAFLLIYILLLPFYLIIKVRQWIGSR